MFFSSTARRRGSSVPGGGVSGHMTSPVIIQFLLESVRPDLPSLANFHLSLHGEGF